MLFGVPVWCTMILRTTGLYTRPGLRRLSFAPHCALVTIGGTGQSTCDVSAGSAPRRSNSFPAVPARASSGAAEIVAALGDLDAAPELIPYTLSAGARLLKADAPPEPRFIPWPARGLLAAWARGDVPRIDGRLRPANVIHATNSLAPPSHLPTLL